MFLLYIDCNNIPVYSSGWFSFDFWSSGSGTAGDSDDEPLKDSSGSYKEHGGKTTTKTGSSKLSTMRCAEDAEYIAAAALTVTTRPESIRVVPYPGFVIKAKRNKRGDTSKVFINVFHHTCVKDEHMMLTYVPYDAAVAAEGEVTAATTADVTATPLVYAAVSASCTEDREGYVSLLYNVLVSSAYFERATVLEEEVHITHPTAVNKVSSTCCLFL